MSNFRKILKKLVHSPYVDFSVGTVLMVSGLWEAWGTLFQDISNLKFGAHHGVIVFGFVSALKAITDIFAGFEFMDEAEYADKKGEGIDRGFKKPLH